MKKNINKFEVVEIDGKPYYRVTHIPTGRSAIFEYDDSLVTEIQAYTEEHRKSLVPRDGSGPLTFPKSPDGTGSLSLAAFLFACYEDIPIEDVRRGYVRHIGNTFLPDGSEDCRKDNLVHMRGAQPVTRSRSFTKETIAGADYLVLQTDYFERPVYFDFSDRLYELLADLNHFKSFFPNGDGRPQARAKYFEPYIGQIAQAFYLGLIDSSNYNNWQEILYQMTSDKGLTVDHFDSDIFNNTRRNLSLMQGTINQSKKDLTALFYPPYGIWCAHDDLSGSYLLMVEADGIGGHLIRCKDDSVLLNFLKFFSGKPALTKRLKTLTVADEAWAVSYPTLKNIISDEQSKAVKSKALSDIKDRLSISAELLALYQTAPERFTDWQGFADGMTKDKIARNLCMMYGRPVVAAVTQLGKKRRR